VVALVLFLAWPILARRGSNRSFLVGASLIAMLLSAGYIAVYLRGGPRIIDATMYFLQGRALSHGALAWTLPDPATEVVGRFLVTHEGADGAAVAGIFPPGYPAVLALGFLVGAPMAIGPLLAAALVWATWWLATEVVKGAEGSELASALEGLPRLAVAFGVVCAALRYHSADTMSHGLSALCFTVSAAGALHLVRRSPNARRRLVSVGLGVALGWLVATRPVSSMAGAALVLFILARSSQRRALVGQLPLVSLGMLPGLGLLALHQRAATGAWFTSSQFVYYGQADGPPGCFRYGFGDRVGCLNEHGDFVREYIPDGFSGMAVVGTTLRRLAMHAMDAGNIELLAPMVLLGVVFGWRLRSVRWLALGVVLLVLAYVPFYFDGNYPGGGARLLADVLPIEHVLLAVGVSLAVRRFGRRQGERSGQSSSWIPGRIAGAALAIAVLGFAFRAGHHHAHLRDRDGGRPMFEPAVVEHAGIHEGLVFVDTDHGFNLAHNPFATGRVSFVRARGDALDVLAWAHHGYPPAYRYEFDPRASAGSKVPEIVSMSLPATMVATIEAESLWPPRRQDGAWVTIEHATGPCSSGGRRLRLRTVGELDEVELDVPAGAVRGRSIRPVVAVSDGTFGVELDLTIDGQAVKRWSVPVSEGEGWTCKELEPVAVVAGAEKVRLTLRAPHMRADTTLALDRIVVSPPS